MTERGNAEKQGRAAIRGASGSTNDGHGNARSHAAVNRHATTAQRRARRAMQQVAYARRRTRPARPSWSFGLPAGLWAGGSFAAAPTATIMQTNSAASWIHFDVKSDIQAFLNGAPNYGWLVKKSAAGHGGGAGHGHAHAGGKRDTDRHGDGDRDADTHAKRNAERDANPHANRDGNENPDADADANPDGDFHGYADADPD